MSELPTYLTTEQLAQRYGVNTDTARRWLRNGRLPGFRFGNSYRVRLDDLERIERDQLVQGRRPGRPFAGPGQ